MSLILIICFIAWMYIVSVLRRANLGFYTFLVGSVGLFIFSVTFMPFIKDIIVRNSVMLLSYIGDYTGMYESYAQYGVFLVNNAKELISLYVDFECSGVIEILVFICLLTFFPAYTAFGKIKTGILGVILILFFNYIRMLFILVVLYYTGMEYYFICHTIIGRIIFYVLTLVLYYNVFTKKQLETQKVGDIAYVASSDI